MVTGVFLGYVVQSTKKINPFLNVVCHSCVNFTLLIFRAVCVYVCMGGCMNACFLQVIKVKETFELILHLHSYLQIKAKNYDKVEKVSVHHTHES